MNTEENTSKTEETATASPQAEDVSTTADTTTEKNEATNTKPDTTNVPGFSNADELIKSDVYHTYYLSNNDYPCEPIVTLLEFEGDSYYPFVKTKPDASMKSPKFDWTNYCWVENSTAELSSQVVKMKKQVKEINDSVDNLNKERVALAQKDESSQKKMDEMQKMLANSNMQMGQTNVQINQIGAMVSQLVQALNGMSKTQAPQESTETNTKPAANADTTTDSAENSAKEGDK